MDPKYSSGRTKASVCKYSTEKRGSHNKFCKYAKEYMYIRRGSKLIRKACDRTCSERPGRSRILQHIFHRSQKGRRFSPDSKSEGTEYIFESAPFQDGDSKNNHLCIRTKRLGSFHGFKGCVPSRRSVSSTQKVSTILHYGKSLPISSHALRPGSSAKNLHKAHGSDRQLSQSTGDSDLHVPRRLADKKSEPRDSRKSIQDGVTVDRAPRSHSKSCQVSFAAQSGDSVPRGRVQSPGGNDLSYIGEMYKNTGGNQVANVSDTSDSTVISPCFRIDGVLHRPNTTGTITYAPYPVLYPVILAPTQGQLVSCYPSAGYVDSTPQMVAGLQQYYGRDTSSSIPFYSSMDRCFPDGMGGTYGGPSGLWHLDRAGEGAAHQLVRDESCSTSTHSFPTYTFGEKSASEMRQLDSCVAHKQTGGDKVLSPMLPNVGDISVGSEEQGQSEGGPHSRKKECLSGRLVQRQKGSKTDGMELRSGNSITHFPEIYDSQFGPVCDEGEQEVASVLLALSRSASMGNRCSKCRLEEHLCLCLSTSNHNSAGSEKGTTATVHSDIDCPIGTQTVMVPQSAGTSHRLSKEATSARKDVNAKKGSSRSRRSRKSKPCGLENIRVSEPTPRFSKRARDYIKQARRVSTRKLYDARLSIYRGWCDEQSVSATSASIEELANFFVYLHEVRKCKATTIAGYRSAIASIHKGIAGTSVSQDKTLSSLIKGIFNSDPDLRPLLPNWDLPSVLGALVASPFEPLSTCDMKYLTWKTVFLLALATASRVSELHALSVNENNLRVDNSGIRLLPNLQFLAKTQRVNKAWKPYFIPIFDSYASDPEDILLCPCRALRIYLDRTRSLRGNVDNLFLTYQKGLCKAAAKSSLSRWIVSLIRYVYEDLPHGPLFNVRAHDTRRLSASWALFNGASIQDILQAAHWAAETTFTSFYLKDVVWNEDRFARASVLETAQWARRSRSCHQNRQ